MHLTQSVSFTNRELPFPYFILIYRFLIMDIDSNCLFADVSNCNEIETPCHDLCTTPTNTDERSSLLGCNTKIESLILQYGKIDVLPCNIEEFHVCNNHVNLIISSRFIYCCLCKPFGRSKSSKSGLRIISKLYAFAAWKKSQVRFSFGRKMCTQCRNDLETFYITKERKQECDALFEWLYDVNLNHTPSKSNSDSYNALSQSFHDLAVEEKQTLLKEFLQSNFKKYKSYLHGLFMFL
jgi:hypothetical protein